MNNMFSGTGVNPGFKDYSHQLLDSKDSYYESEHEFSPVLTKTGNPIADRSLPVVPSHIDGKFPHNIRVVINPCTFVALDTEALEKNRYSFVPANGGKDYEVTYTAEDAAAGVLTADNKIVTRGAKKVFKGNVPSGMVFYHVLQNPMCRQGHKIDQFQTAMSIYREGFVIIPHIYKTKDSKYDFKIGDYIAPDAPTEADLENNPKAKVGGVRVWCEDADTALKEGQIKRDNFITYGTKKDSQRMAMGQVISVVDIDNVHRDRTYYSEDYGSDNFAGPTTNGYLPTYWDYWKEGHEATGYGENCHNKYSRKDEYKMKLIYVLLGKK